MYLSNINKYKKSIYTSKKRRLKIIQEIVFNYLSLNPCVDCGITDVVVLEFDHKSNKEFNIGEAIKQGTSHKRILNEITKCEVRCANCHKRKTHQDQNSWRYKLNKERSKK
jgi:Asp/Glu/hydantoin racemase